MSCIVLNSNFVAPHASALALLLADTDAYVRGAAAATLGGLGSASAPHALELARLLEDDSNGGSVRETAVASIIKLGPAAAGALAFVAKAIEHFDRDVKVLLQETIT